jgi:hypothetical protein
MGRPDTFLSGAPVFVQELTCLTKSDGLPCEDGLQFDALVLN